jgi:hypothetical protein
LLCLLVCGGMGAAACASAGGAHADCSLRPIDSTFVGRLPVYRDCAVSTKARLLTERVSPDYRPESSRRATCYSAEVMFVVDTLGRPETSTAQILHATNPEIGTSLVTMLPKLRYEPAQLNGRPVRQITTEKRALSTVTVVVPAGSGPPSTSQMRGQMPKC